MRSRKQKVINPQASWKTIFFKDSGGISSKRFCGVVGWFICLAILITGFVVEKGIPDYAELIAVTSASMLGIDCVTSIWSKNIHKGDSTNILD